MITTVVEEFDTAYELDTDTVVLEFLAVFYPDVDLGVLGRGGVEHGSDAR